MFNETAYDYASAAGCSADQARTAAAVAQAESGGNPRAHNAVPPDDSYGLWQINMLGPLGPARRAAFGISSNDALYDPATNARAMFQVSGGCSNFNPWTTYTHGTYRAFLQPAPGGGSISSGDGGGTTVSPDAGDGGIFESLNLPTDLFSGISPVVVLGAAAALYFLMK